MKQIKENTKFIIVIKICIFGSAISGYAASSINSSEVKYDNSASGLTSTNVQAAIEELNNNATDYATVISRLNNIVNVVYPVGSIYISTSGTNPANLFGGTWVAFGTGRTLVGINTSDGDFNSVEKTGGSKTRTLSVANIPAHTHNYVKATGVGGHTLTVAEMPSHRHDIGKYVGMVYSTNALTINDSNFDGIMASDNFSPTVNSTALTQAQRDTIISYTGGSGSHNHPLNTTTAATESTGSTSAFSTMNPYITVYMWKRTA